MPLIPQMSSYLMSLTVVVVILFASGSVGGSEEVPCHFDDWSTWSECTVSCGVAGGQKYRERTLLSSVEVAEGQGCVGDLKQVNIAEEGT